ncbi:MAG: serine hydrolase domain-containing protein [Kofleriaceae bacterium]|nr:serine hydrolase domain-containing protein [Kofleriaceae bacterium]
MFQRVVLVAVLAAACGGRSPSTIKAPEETKAGADPDGPHRAAVTAHVKPFIDAEIMSSLVVGLYDGGKTEVYGFGAGPGGKPPTGTTLFELGSITKVYTSLLLADAVQRREVALDAPVAELLPPGVPVPTRDKTAITLEHLAVHASGLPRLPPSLLAAANKPDPYAGYGEEALYQDLVRTELQATPGTGIAYSNYGVGLLGFALGRRLGGGYASALETRVLQPLKLEDTYVIAPPGLPGRAQGTNEDLAPVPPWTWDALAGAGSIVSTANDQLKLIDAELEAAAGAMTTLRPPMRLTQEIRPGGNVALGWQVDREGRYWHNGGTGGFHSFLMFDPRTRRGIVVLAATSTTLVDGLAAKLFKVLDNAQTPTPSVFPTADTLAPLAGTYNFSGQRLVVSVRGKRLYLEGPGEPRHRLLPLSETEFFIEPLQAVAVFQKDGDKVARLVFALGENTFSAPRVE